MVALPLAKLVYLGVKQLSKPIVTRLKIAAKENSFFRHYICMPPAQAHHWLELNVKMRLMGFKGKAEIKPLNETKAIELGSEILGETLVFGIAAATIIAEYYRGQRNDKKKENQQNDTLALLVEKVSELELQMQQQSTELTELRRGTYYQGGSQVASKSNTAILPSKGNLNENQSKNVKEQSSQPETEFSFISWISKGNSTKSDHRTDERTYNSDDKHRSTNMKNVDYKK